MNVESAQPADLDGIRRLLSAAALPIADLTPEALRLFHVVRDRRALAGAVGLERHGDLALLRSLVVAPAFRGRGLGVQLVQAAEAHAQQLALSSIYLLTTTAAEFFAARGFSAVRRSEVPVAIQATTEFASLCPSTAIVLTKRVSLPSAQTIS